VAVLYIFLLNMAFKLDIISSLTETGKWNRETCCCIYCWTYCTTWPPHGSCWRCV